MAEIDDIDLLRRRVINVVGHELRTPVTTLRGLADSLAVADDEETRRALTQALVRSATRLERLVDDLLLAARVTTAVPAGDAVEVDLADALRRAGWTGPIEGEATALVRRESAVRLLQPVVDNARRHGEQTVARLYGGAVEIESAGPELPEGDVALALEPFYRGETAVMTAPGLGLGLSITATIARAEGGDVEVAGRPDGGLIVRIELPQP